VAEAIDQGANQAQIEALLSQVDGDRLKAVNCYQLIASFVRPKLQAIEFSPAPVTAMQRARHPAIPPRTR
jgi:hypothetical protein